MSSDAVSAQLVLALARVLYSNGQMTDQVITAAHRLAAALGLDARIIVRWAGLSLVQTTTVNGAIKRRVLATVKASPKGVNMDRVAAAMGVVADVETGRLRPAQACVKLDAIATRPPAPDWMFALAAGAGAVALAEIFGLRHLPGAALIFGCVVMGALLRRALGRHTGNPLVQPFAAALLAGIVGALAVRFDLSSSLRLVAVCPCMVLVPGPQLLNAAADMLKGRMRLGASRLINAALVIAAIAAGLLAGLTIMGVSLPTEPAALNAALWADMIAAGIAVLAYSVFFSTPVRMILWPVAVGVIAHAVRWWMLALGCDVAMAAFIACLCVGLVLTPVSHRYHMPFAAVGFAAVVSMIPGVFLFRMASGLLEILRGTGDGSALDQTLTNGLASASILLAMSLGLIGAKRIIDLLIDPERFHVTRTALRLDR